MGVRACRGRGSLRLILGLAALAFVLAGCAHSGTSRAGAQPQPAAKTEPATKIESFSAYDASGELAVKVADVARGSCWTNSVAAPAPDAFRCFAGNNILDPCFARPKASAPGEVACLATPWSAATVLTLTAPLPQPDPDAGNRAWAFQLDNGARCVASTGTVPQVQGINLGYHCTDGSDAALRDVSAPLVTADYGEAKTQAVQSVTVTRIWRG
jgi:eukaryotic-like serine/threonine-protein kinase